MNRLKEFGFLPADGISVERCGGFYRDHGEELEEMIWNHIPQSAGSFVKAAALLDPHGLGRGNLDMIDVITVPHRFEDPVREAQHHDVLNGFFAEEMIDSINLILGKN